MFTTLLMSPDAAFADLTFYTTYNSLLGKSPDGQFLQHDFITSFPATGTLNYSDFGMVGNASYSASQTGGITTINEAMSSSLDGSNGGEYLQFDFWFAFRLIVDSTYSLTSEVNLALGGTDLGVSFVRFAHYAAGTGIEQDIYLNQKYHNDTDAPGHVNSQELGSASGNLYAGEFYVFDGYVDASDGYIYGGGTPNDVPMLSTLTSTFTAIPSPVHLPNPYPPYVPPPPPPVPEPSTFVLLALGGIGFAITAYRHSS